MVELDLLVGGRGNIVMWGETCAKLWRRINGKAGLGTINRLLQ